MKKISPSVAVRYRILILGFTAFAAIDNLTAQQGSEYSAVDAIALSVSRSESLSIERLAAALGKGPASEREKARAIYRWITKNISYDTHAFFSGNLGDVSATNVLKSMKGVCDGYAQLFTALAARMGLEAERITGNSKGYGYVVGSPIEGPANHAWNAVRIGGEWRLVDCTWGAGYIDDRKQFVQRFNDYYFLTPADQFIFDHFPEDAQKQFLFPTVSKQSYEALANVEPAFFFDGLKLKSNKEGVIRASGRVDVLIGAPTTTLLLAQLIHEDKVLDPSLTYISRNSDEATITALLPERGKFILRLFAKQQRDHGQEYEKALDYQVIADRPMSQKVSFPILYDAFATYGLRLSGSLERESMVDRQTSLTLISAPEIVVIASLEKEGSRMDETFTFVSSENGVHNVRAVFPRPGTYSVNIFAKRKTESGNYNAVLTYRFDNVGSADPNVGFPVVYEQYRERNAFLYSPMNGHVKAGEPQVYRIRVTNAEDVAVMSNGQWSHLKKDGNVFEGSATIGAGKAEIFARFPGNQQFVGLLHYEGVK